ncbi:MAG TPA: YciI family protein [Plantibacter sp.]|uniref:YciI family protein n=1 Tax=unclassified Plantibacter TaxID=2624265 RepID=UPI002D08C003|nr:YciI family protein [Plantibacter sp.]
MKYMLIMRATAEAKAAYENVPFQEIIEKMGAYNEALASAGVLLAGEGLADDLTDSFVVDFAGETPAVTDGPYGEIHELFNGFWIIQVSSKEEAAQWASRAPLGAGSKLEVRRVTEMSDFADFADTDAIKNEAVWRAEHGQE